MKRSLLLPTLGVVGGLLALSPCAGAQPVQLPEPLSIQDFNQDTGGWISIGDGTKVLAEHATENVKEGGGALRFDYNVAPGNLGALICPVTTHSLTTLQSISFWVKSNRDTSFIFALQEQNGGRFGTAFSVTANQWQHVEISPDELVLQKGNDDPKDANGKLDMAEVEGAAFLDLDLLLAGLAADTNNPLVKLLGLQNGPRSLYVDDVVFSGKPFGVEAPDKSVLDEFRHPQAAWLKVGAVTLKTVQDAQTKKGMLQADYPQSTTRLSAFAKLLAPGILAKKQGMSFQMASRRRATLIVQLEETSGGKYNAVLQVPADTTPSLQEVKFADFKPSDDSKDNNGRLDLEQVKQLLIIDASALLGGADGEGDNTLWLGELRAR